MLAADATAVLSVIAPRALRHGGPIEMRPDSDALSGPALPLAVRLDTPRPKCKSAATRVMSARKRANAVRAGENQASRKRLAGTRFDIFGLGHVYAPAAARRRYPDDLTRAGRPREQGSRLFRSMFEAHQTHRSITDHTRGSIFSESPLLDRTTRSCRAMLGRNAINTRTRARGTSPAGPCLPARPDRVRLCSASLSTYFRGVERGVVLPFCK